MELACRDRMGVFNATFFRLWSCSMCYTYLFHDAGPSFTTNLPNGHQLVALPTSPHPPGLTVVADVGDPAVVAVVCAGLRPSDCDRWTACCHAADRCCRLQVGGQQTDGDQVSGVQSLWPGAPPFSTTRDSTGQTPSYLGPTTPYTARLRGHEVKDRMTAVTSRDDVRRCPGTWDGFGCFADTLAGHTASISCPSYIEHNDPHGEYFERVAFPHPSCSPC